jgi:hypothetical protein
MVRTMTSTKYDEAIERVTPFMQGLYRSMRMEGFDRATAKNILEIAIKCAIVNESFGKGIDSDAVCKHMRLDGACLKGASSTGKCKEHCSYYETIK